VLAGEQVAQEKNYYDEEGDGAGRGEFAAEEECFDVFLFHVNFPVEWILRKLRRQREPLNQSRL